MIFEGKSLKPTKDSNDPASVLTRSDTKRSRFYEKLSLFDSTAVFMEDAMCHDFIARLKILDCQRRVEILPLGFLKKKYASQLENQNSLQLS